MIGEAGALIKPRDDPYDGKAMGLSYLRASALS